MHDIGHNNPPTPFDDIATEIGNLYDEAETWLDGDPIETQGQADAVDKLAAMIKDAAKRAEEMRKEEVRPYDEGKAAVQERYAPLIAKTKGTTGKAVLALEACQAALTPWKNKILAEKKAEADRIRAEAERKKAEAEAAIRSAPVDNLADRADAEEKLKDAKKADAAATKAEKTGATGLRTYRVAKITDANAFARYLWTEERTSLMAFLETEAQKMAAAKKTNIPGLEITEERRAI